MNFLGGFIMGIGTLLFAWWGMSKSKFARWYLMNGELDFALFISLVLILLGIVLGGIGV